MNMNIDSISAITTAQQALSVNMGEFSKIAESIATGKNSNVKPADKYISQNIDTDTKARYTAIENAQQGMSLTGVADSALDEVGNALSKIKELSTKAANDTYSTDQRKAIQEEINQYADQINKTLEGANYNGKPVVNVVNDVNPDEADKINFQVGTGTGSGSQISYDPNIKLDEMKFDVTTTAGAQEAMNKADEMLTAVTSKQSDVAAVQSGLTASVEQNATAIINNQSSYSKIEDTDYATAMVDLMKSKISTESLVKVIKAGYQSQASVLQLIGGSN